jgi:hypothetical protein
MSEESLLGGVVDGIVGEEDEFHDANGDSVLGDADPIEVCLFAHHCWVMGLDPEATAHELRGE